MTTKRLFRSFMPETMAEYSAVDFHTCASSPTAQTKWWPCIAASSAG